MSATGASAPREGSMTATAQFDVPRSTPTRYSRDIPLTAAYVQLEIPAAGPVFFQTTQFERSDFCDGGLQIDRYQSSGVTLQRRLDRRDLFEFVASHRVFHDFANTIVSPHRGSE